jgi:electron transport complex protein RnfE
MRSDLKDLTLKGLWSNNPALVQLLGLCPLLAVSTTIANALGLGLATLLVLVVSNVSVSLVRNIVSNAIRLPVFVLIIASAVTCTELLMQAYSFELYEVLGIFLPLITTNCAILGRAEAFASKNALLPAAYDGLMMGFGFALVLVVLGAIRELLGTGILFADMQLLFGSQAATWRWVVFEDYEPFLLAVLPPGAFIFTGLLIALKNRLDQHFADKQTTQGAIETGSKRARVTGVIR